MLEKKNILTETVQTPAHRRLHTQKHTHTYTHLLLANLESPQRGFLSKLEVTSLTGKHSARIKVTANSQWGKMEIIILSLKHLRADFNLDSKSLDMQEKMSGN